MTHYIRGDRILQQVKRNVKSLVPALADKQVVIVRFACPEGVLHPLEVARYEAARISTERKVKTFAVLGCHVKQSILPYATLPKTFAVLLGQENVNPYTTGIIIQNPVPSELNPVLESIFFEKDLDGMRSYNPYFPVSATSETISRLVQSFASETDTVAVVGAKGYVGKGVVQLLEQAAISTIELDAGDDLARIRAATMVVSATGVPDLLDERHIVTAHRLVVDTGFVPMSGYPLRGDVNCSASNIPQNLTPVPGGIGPLQMATLIERLVSRVSEVKLVPWEFQFA